MPANYPGDSTATQAPGPQPAAGAIPIGALPVDGDPPNAATFEQAYKECLDYIAWLMAPTPLPASWTQPAWYVQNARELQRFTIDHMGFPSGDIVQLVEKWRGNDLQTTTTAGHVFTAADLQWTAIVNTTAVGRIDLLDPDMVTVPHKPQRYLNMILGTGVIDFTKLVGQNLVVFSDDNSISMEFDVYTGTGVDQQTVSIGLCNPANNLEGDFSDFIGGVLTKRDGSANWKTITGDGAALSGLHDTGVPCAVNTKFRVRMEWWGANVADDNVAQIRFLIDGADAGVFTANIPTASAATSLVAPVISVKRTSGATARAISVGPVKISYNLT